MQDFRHVDAWAKAHDLVLRIHEATKAFPKEEAFGLAALIRRNTVFVAMRIAEGSGYSSAEESGAAFRRAAAATNEVEYSILLARDLGYWEKDVAGNFMDTSTEVRKMIYGLLRKRQ